METAFLHGFESFRDLNWAVFVCESTDRFTFSIPALVVQLKWKEKLKIMWEQKKKRNKSWEVDGNPLKYV